MINAALFIGWALAVVLFDCRLRRIPNWLVIAGLVVACAVVASGRSPFHIHITDAAFGLIGGLLGLLPFYLFGVMGAADVKVFATLGAWCGVHALPALWIAASIAGGIHAVYLLASAAIRSRRNVDVNTLHASHVSAAGDAGNMNAFDADEVVEGDLARSRRYSTFVVGGRRATPYAALLAVSAIGSLTLHVLEAAR
jgi:prepilin peptidase CpaA